MWIWLLIGLAVVFACALTYWAFVITEGAFLGARVVAWTYDLAARKYDAIKQFNPIDDAWLIASPMMAKLGEVNGPLILDLATGTGRMPLALLNHPRFRGYVIGLDLSKKMLHQAQRKLHKHAGRYTLLWRDAQDLPFPDATFDGVSCLEALEFIPSPQRLLSEMARVLRPGGVFLVTNRVNWERKLMPGKAFTDDEMRAMLRKVGVVGIEIRRWQVYYDLIWAHKVGEPSRLGRATQEVGEALRCPSCQATPLLGSADGFRCPSCDRTCVVENNVIYM